MRKITYTITEEYNQRPLLHFLKGYVKLSTFIIRSMKTTPGSILINGVHHRVVDKVSTGDSLTLTIPEKTEPPLLWEKALEILFEDDDLLVINKPSGISVHPTHNHPNYTLCNAVAYYLINSNNEPAAARAIGRLDKVTSGVMIFAKNSFSASRLNGNMQKIYNALAWGEMEKEGTIDAPIFRPDKNKTTRTVDERGDPSVTHWRLIESKNNQSFIEVKTETGRTHQIRVHCNHIGHPLVGDSMYNSPVTENLTRAALHCRQISFVHPVTNEEVTFVAPLPEDMKKELEKNGFCVDKQHIIC